MGRMRHPATSSSRAATTAAYWQGEVGCATEIAGTSSMFDAMDRCLSDGLEAPGGRAFFYQPTTSQSTLNSATP